MTWVLASAGFVVWMLAIGVIGAFVHAADVLTNGRVTRTADRALAPRDQPTVRDRPDLRLVVDNVGDQVDHDVFPRDAA